jgi:trimeric autotransporter adhesin
MKPFIFFLAFIFCSNAMVFCQPTLIKDMSVGTSPSLVNVDNAMARVGAYIFFPSTKFVIGAELWKTDGTFDGTKFVRDINPGSNSSRLDNFYALNDSLLLFTADDGQNGLELWRSDGSNWGTFMVKNIGPDTSDGIFNFVNNPKRYCIFNNKLYFVANDGETGLELWSSDGTEAGTTLVKDIYTGEIGSKPSNFEVHNGTLFFNAGNEQYGNELWKTDGTTAGTQLVIDIKSGVFGSEPSSLYSIGNTLIFVADDGIHDAELWKTDGTTTGTVLVKDIRTITDGTFNTSGITSVPTSFSENRFIRIGNIAFFAAIDDANGIELWRTDGTTAGTYLVKDASTAVGLNGYAPQNFTQMGNEIYYKYKDDSNGIELWKSDGTVAGTKMVKNLSAGDLSSFGSPTYLFAHLGKVYFGANPVTTGRELYESDGTETGTKLVADIHPGTSSSSPNRFISLDEKLIFWATSPATGTEPWVYTPDNISTTYQISDRIHLALQPNPVSSVANWSVDNEIAISGRIVQANGQVIRQLNATEINQRQMYAQQLSNGFYYLVLDLKTGKTVYTQFVVAK